MKISTIILIFIFGVSTVICADSGRLTVELRGYTSLISNIDMAPFLIYVRGKNQFDVNELPKYLLFQSTADSKEVVNIGYKVVFVKQDNYKTIYCAIIDEPIEFAGKITVVCSISPDSSIPLKMFWQKTSSSFIYNANTLVYHKSDYVNALINANKFSLADAILSIESTFDANKPTGKVELVSDLCQDRIHLFAARDGVKEALLEYSRLQKTKWGVFSKKNNADQYSVIFLNQLYTAIEEILQNEGNIKLTPVKWNRCLNLATQKFDDVYKKTNNLK